MHKSIFAFRIILCSVTQIITAISLIKTGSQPLWTLPFIYPLLCTNKDVMSIYKSCSGPFCCSCFGLFPWRKGKYRPRERQLSSSMPAMITWQAGAGTDSQYYTVRLKSGFGVLSPANMPITLSERL